MLTTRAGTFNDIPQPLIASMYLKKDFANDENVLVIDANFDRYDGKNFDGYLMSLLLGLEDLKERASESIGAFDRVDIRTH